MDQDFGAEGDGAQAGEGGQLPTYIRSACQDNLG